jgi:tripartite ATP-independent transporter DctM subunit
MTAGAVPGPDVGSPALCWPDRVAGLICRGTAIFAAILLALEVGTLLIGVISRYLFHSPIVWTDEIAGDLFLWLSMAGAIIALEREQHMRMTTFVDRAPPRRRSLFNALSVSVTFVFLAALLSASYEYAIDEAYVITPTLEISGAWRAAAVPVGMALMLLLSVLRVLRSDKLQVVASVAGIGLAFGALALAQEPLIAIGNYNLLVFFCLGAPILILAGVPIAFAFGSSTALFIMLIADAPETVFMSRMTEGMSHLILLSVPLFVLLGLLIEMTGMAAAMVGFLARLLGHFRGGLSYVLLGAMCLVSGISGSKTADMAAIGPVLFPEMRKRNANPGELAALLSTTAAMTETIPPSLVIIAIGSVTGVSISALFAGGVMPALVMAAFVSAVIWWRSRGDDMSGVARATSKEIAWAFWIAMPATVLPFIIRAAVVEGVATATEVSTVGIAYSVIVGLLVYRQFDWRKLLPIAVETATLSGAIMLIIGCATAMSWAITQSGFAHALAAFMAAAPGGARTFLVVSIAAFVVLGSLLEGLPALVLFGPLLFPIAKELGIHEVHYAMVVILAMAIGLFSPPFGVGYYVACAIGKVDPAVGMRKIGAYIVAMILGLLLIAFVPWFSIGFLK